MSETITNLQKAIEGETKAKKKYNLFSQKAKAEGYDNLAYLFRAISLAEQIHINNHRRAISISEKNDAVDERFEEIDITQISIDVKNTRLNLENVIKAEMDEFKKMYKNYIKTAEKENFDVAKLSFSLARKAEKQHAKAFKEYLKYLKKEKKILFKKIYICQICGNIEFDNPPENCPVCDHSQKFFKEINF